MPTELSTSSISNFFDKYVIDFGIKIALALAVFIIGKMVVKFIVKAVDKSAAGRLDESLRKFLISILRGILLAFVVIAALGQLGIETTGIVAILGAAGLAIGFALQGSLGNFAAGVLLIIFKPYKIGDLVKLAGEVGVVESIEVFNTIIVTPDNRTIIIPNGSVGNASIENLSAKGILRVDMVFGIGYGDDIKKAKEIMDRVIAADSRVLKDPAVQIAVSELADSSVNFVVRPWCKVEDYWGVQFDSLENIKLAFDKAGISIPFPQSDVYMHNVA